MNLDNILRLINNFFHTHTFIVFGIIAGLIIFAWLKPKQVFKTILLLLGVAAVGYILYYIGEAAMSGMSGKSRMISK